MHGGLMADLSTKNSMITRYMADMADKTRELSHMRTGAQAHGGSEQSSAMSAMRRANCSNRKAFMGAQASTGSAMRSAMLSGRPHPSRARLPHVPNANRTQ